MIKHITFMSIVAGMVLHAQDSWQLVDVRNIPNIVIEMRYATERNATGRPMRSSHACFLCQPVAQALACVQQELDQYGYCLKVFEAYQPLSEQQICKMFYQDADDVAIDGHCRGCSVDVTLVCKDSHEELAMGTDYDCCSPEACLDCPTMPDAVQNNRQLLCDMMQKHGFFPTNDCWWHFDYQGWQQAPLLDIPFSVLS